MWDCLGHGLGMMVQVTEEVVSYLVRYFLHQVIGLLHLLCSEMLRYWLGLLLQSIAQTEDTREAIEHLSGEDKVLLWQSCSQQLLRE